MSVSSALLSDLTSAVIADGSNNIKVDQDILRKLDITPYDDDLDISQPTCGNEASLPPLLFQKIQTLTLLKRL